MNSTGPDAVGPRAWWPARGRALGAVSRVRDVFELRDALERAAGVSIAALERRGGVWVARLRVGDGLVDRPVPALLGAARQHHLDEQTIFAQPPLGVPFPTSRLYGTL